MASNQKKLVKRIIEPGNRHYNFGVYTATSYGGRQLTAVIEGTYRDAVDLAHGERTASGNTVKGFKRLKTES